MRAHKLMIHWHVDESEVGKGGISAIFSADFQPGGTRLATGGQDCNVRIWQLSKDSEPVSSKPSNGVNVQYLATLKKHTQTVNVVRFSPSGKYLASAGDDGLVYIWELDSAVETASKKSRAPEFGGASNEMEDDVESWSIAKSFSAGTKEVYDLAWSPDSSRVVVGSLENIARVFDLRSGQTSLLKGQDHYVQGVAWDPQDEFVAAQSADRSICIYRLGNGGSTFSASPKIVRRELPPTNQLQHLYHSESLRSFFRRLCFTPDGNLLLTPAGILKEDAETEKHVIYIYTRAGLAAGTPAACLEGLESPALIVSCCPSVFERKTVGPSAFNLPYTMVFAVATADTVLFYSTESRTPLGMVKNMHYLPITDLAWDRDGSKLLVTSMDGICSVVVFDIGADLGAVCQLQGPPAPQTAGQKVQTIHSLLKAVPPAEEPQRQEPATQHKADAPEPKTNEKKKRRIQPTLVQLTK